MAQTEAQAPDQAPRQRRRDDRGARPHRPPAERRGEEEAGEATRDSPPGAAEPPADVEGLVRSARCSRPASCSSSCCSPTKRQRAWLRSSSPLFAMLHLHPRRLLPRDVPLPPPAAQEGAWRRRNDRRPHVHRRAGAGELLLRPRQRAPIPRSSSTPARRPERLLEALPALGITSVEAILITHTHFDHVGAVAPLARATGAPVYCPELESEVLADIMSYVPLARLRAVRELRGRRRRSPAARRWSSPG